MKSNYLNILFFSSEHFGEQSDDPERSFTEHFHVDTKFHLISIDVLKINEENCRSFMAHRKKSCISNTRNNRYFSIVKIHEHCMLFKLK